MAAFDLDAVFFANLVLAGETFGQCRMVFLVRVERQAQHQNVDNRSIQRRQHIVECTEQTRRIGIAQAEILVEDFSFLVAMQRQADVAADLELSLTDRYDEGVALL